MGGDDRSSSSDRARRQEQTPRAGMAIGSDRLHRNVVALDEGDRKTRKMDAAQFQQLLGTERTTKPLDAVGTPQEQKRASTAELLATVDDAFAEFAEPEPAVIVEDQRIETRHAGRMAPITKPPPLEPPPLPVAPSRMMLPLFAIAGVLIAAILVGVVLLVIK